jgi:hypothetical protein
MISVALTDGASGISGTAAAVKREPRVAGRRGAGGIVGSDWAGREPT